MTVQYFAEFCLLLLLLGAAVQSATSFQFKRQTSASRLTRRSMSMTKDTVIDVSSSFEHECSLVRDHEVSLDDYMQLPVEQYVCIKMPLDATLERMHTTIFNLTVPPVKFFNLEVSPMLVCEVTQDKNSVVIRSNSCTLRGSPYVEGLNGCYDMNIETRFRWMDAPEKKSIQSSSRILVEVDPPPPFKYFPKKVLTSTGHLAMSIALKQIENAFVQSLAKDYERWATDEEYRARRAESAKSQSCVIVENQDII